ncbi:MAG: copper chaperone PCu(A)C [Gammaproteobacteria bacterium]
MTSLFLSRRQERRSHLMTSPSVVRTGGSDALGVAMILAITLALSPSIALAQAPITVDDAWVRAAPPAAQVLAGYFTVQNAARKTVTLTRVESPNFARVEMHRTRVVDGVSRMEPVESVEVPARGNVVFAPGGLHLMLMDPLGSMAPGTTVYFVLTFDNGWTFEVTAPVRTAD